MYLFIQLLTLAGAVQWKQQPHHRLLLQNPYRVRTACFTVHYCTSILFRIFSTSLLFPVVGRNLCFRAATIPPPCS